jgi:hypothetical protein
VLAALLSLYIFPLYIKVFLIERERPWEQFLRSAINEESQSEYEIDPKYPKQRISGKSRKV